MKIIITFVLLLSTLTTAFTQFLWPENGIPIRQGNHIDWQGESAQNSLGETCYIWSDSRLGGSKIWAQKFDADGDPMWPAGGVMIGDTSLNCYCPPVVCASRDDGFIIAWGDLYQPGGILAQKISVEGTILWGQQGVSASQPFAWQCYVQLISDDDGGVYVMWYMDAGGDSGFYLQRILADGSIAHGWDPQGMLVSTEPGTAECIGRMCQDGAGGVILAWGQSLGYPEIDIYAQRVDANGDELWNPGGEVICGLPGWQNSPMVCEDGNGGAFMAYRHNDNGDYGLLMQRVDADGNWLWQENGEVLCQETGTQLLQQIIYSGSNCAIAAWEDCRNSAGYTNPDIYCQRIDGSGNLLWDAGGKLVCSGSFDQTEISIDTDNFGGVFISWYDERLGYTNSLIYAQYISVDGSTIWDEGGIVLADLMRSTIPTINHTSDGGTLVAWNNLHDDIEGVYLQKADSSGNIQLPINGEPVFESLANDVGGAELTDFSENRFLAVWGDGREYGVGSRLYYQIFDMDGNAFLTENGLPLCDGIPEGYQTDVKCTATSDDCAIAVWRDSRFGNSDYRIYAQKVDAEGILLWDLRGVEVGPGSDPFVCADLEGGAYVSYDGSGGTNVHRLSEDGQLLWGNQPVVFYEGLVKGIVEDGTGGAIIASRTSFAVDKDVFATRILPEGEIDWTSTICDAREYQDEVCVISSIETGAVISWTDQRINGYYKDIYAAKVDTNGNTPWGEDGIAVCDWESQQRWSQLMEDDDGYIWVSWTDQRGIGYDTYCQRLTAHGDILFQDGGIYVAGGMYDQDDCVMVPDNTGGAIFVWRDQAFEWVGDIYSIHLDEHGQITSPVWNPEGNPVCNYIGSQFDAAAVSDGAGGAITVWTDYRSSTYVEENQTYSDLYMQRINDQITSVKIPASSLNPESCVLYPAFPNPFNPKTTISYYIPAGGNAKITVYNIKSEIVLNLVNEYHPKGYFEKTWDASTCPSGIYFLKLTHRNNTQIAKCVLIK